MSTAFDRRVDEAPFGRDFGSSAARHENPVTDDLRQPPVIHVVPDAQS
jgi:hypothetical protein